MSFHRVTTEDNLELQGALYRPDTETKKVVIHIHGMAGNFYANSFLDYIAKELTQTGYALLSVNNRGHDYIAYFPVRKNTNVEWKQIGNAYEIFEEGEYDIRACINFAEKLGFTDIFLQGHSLGTVKIVYYLSKTQDNRIKGLILISPSDMVGLFIAKDKDRKDWEENLKLAKEMIRKGQGRELLPNKLWEWYHLSANTYVNFSDTNTKTNIFPFYNPDAKFEELATIKCPIVAILGSKDDAVVTDQKISLEILKEKAVASKEVSTFVVYGALHSYIGYEQELATIVRNWLAKQR